MQFNPNGELSEAELLRLETELGFELPEDYRSFMQNCNGGSFSEGYPEIITETDDVVLCDAFFGLNLPDALNVLFWKHEMQGDIPPKSVLIGKAPGGGFFALCSDPRNPGVYYYDHSYSLPHSSDEENTYLVSSSFADLARIVGICSF